MKHSSLTLAHSAQRTAHSAQRTAHSAPALRRVVAALITAGMVSPAHYAFAADYTATDEAGYKAAIDAASYTSTDLKNTLTVASGSKIALQAQPPNLSKHLALVGELDSDGNRPESAPATRPAGRWAARSTCLRYTAILTARALRATPRRTRAVPCISWITTPMTPRPVSVPSKIPNSSATARNGAGR